MTAHGWVALAYGIVLLTLVAYVLSVRHRLSTVRRTQGAATPRTASPR